MKRNIFRELLCILCIGGGLGSIIGLGWTVHNFNEYMACFTMGLLMVVLGAFLLPDGAE